MTVFQGSGLVVSLPGAETRGVDFSGSLVSPREVLAAPISSELRLALRLVETEAERRGMEIKCVIRPEVFVNGVALAWLRQRTRSMSKHLNLSDGAAVKPLEGFETSVFFYDRSRRDRIVALETLSRRAPESMLAIRSQINSGFEFRFGLNGARPEPELLKNILPGERSAVRVWPFVLNHDSAEDSANRIRQLGPVAPESLNDLATDPWYIALTEAAMLDPAFARTVAERVLRAFFNQGSPLILRLPPAAPGEDELATGLQALVRILRSNGIIIPRSVTPDILITMEDPTADDPLLNQRPFHLLLHESFDFWRLGQLLYERAKSIVVFGESPGSSWSRFLPTEITSVYGSNATWG